MGPPAHYHHYGKEAWRKLSTPLSLWSVVAETLKGKVGGVSVLVVTCRYKEVEMLKGPLIRGSREQATVDIVI